MTDALKQAREAHARLSKALDEFDDEVAGELAVEGERADLWDVIEINVSDLRAALSALDALAEPAKVKALVWRDESTVPDGPWSDVRLRQSIGHHNLGRYAGSYTVQEMEAGGVWGWWCTWTSDREPEGVELTKDAAQAAAQVDFERRILSALTQEQQP